MGFRDWQMYSENGNSLIWTDDIAMRLFGKKGMTQEELDALTGGRPILSVQADALKEAAQFVLATLKEASGLADGKADKQEAGKAIRMKEGVWIMKKITVTTYTDEDRELLSKTIPEDPCPGCPDSVGCCGCPRGEAYRKATEPYKKAGILDIAVSIRRYRELEQEHRRIESEMTKLMEKLPDFVRMQPMEQ